MDLQNKVKKIIVDKLEWFLLSEYRLPEVIRITVRYEHSNAILTISAEDIAKAIQADAN